VLAVAAHRETVAVAGGFFSGLTRSLTADGEDAFVLVLPKD
jgi:hypothetical protein